MSAPLTLRLVSRESRICLLSSTSTWAILPVTSPVRIASSHWNSKTCGKGGRGGVERAAGRHLGGDLVEHGLQLDALALRGSRSSRPAAAASPS